MGVDRCVCRDVTFARLIGLSRERGAGLAELQRLTGCGLGCGMCIPYIRLALATGRTDLAPMDVALDDEAPRDGQGRRGADGPPG
jgi:NAD(P)H-nitrite reductase large subunit